jgi:L-malate glycosyltransferase
VKMVALYPAPAESLNASAASTVDLPPEGRGPLSWRRGGYLADAINTFRPDIVQANGSDTLKYSILAKKRSRSDWPIVYRNISIASSWLRYPAHRHWGRWLARQISHVAAVSEESGADYCRTYALPRDKVTVIPIGTHLPESLNPDAARAVLARAAGVGGAERLLIHVGSFSPEKNHVGLLQMFSQVAVREPRAHLVLVGDGPLRPFIETMIARNNLDKRVSVLGTRSDAADLMAGAELLLLPSLIEGLPGVILEAAARAVPCVATDVGSVSAAIDNGRSGMIIEMGDHDSFADAVTDLLQDPVRRQAMGVAARTFIAPRYGMDSIVAMFEMLYHDLMRFDGRKGLRLPAFEIPGN